MQTALRSGSAIDAAGRLSEGHKPHTEPCMPCTQRLTKADGQTLATAPTQLQGTPRQEPGAGTALRRRQSSLAEAASSQLPRSHAEEALGELDAELLRMLAEADLIVARRSAAEAPEPHESGAVRSAVGARSSVPETPVGAAAGVAASDSGLSRSPPQGSAVAPLPVHPADVTAGPPSPAPASQSGDTQVQAMDTACQAGAADVPPATAVGSGDAGPDAVSTAGRAAAAAAAAGPAACVTATVAPGGSGVFAGCSDEDDDVDWEAVIAAPPAGPCEAAPTATDMGMRPSNGDPVAEPPAGPDVLPACVPAAAATAAAAQPTRCAACFLMRHDCAAYRWIAPPAAF